ncbi:hypothetical protein GCM10009864_70980 [Streptomyces lunalinharesii]|uniref:Uncharacterized protein n=1 Tax=Streptomyces lunalinharesii TaxID=333384 RepID=A0ABP6F9Z0_9ACTN
MSLDSWEAAPVTGRQAKPLSLASTPSGVPPWLYPGADVYDTVRDCAAVVTDLGFPGDDPRQTDRAWVRPPGGGREWNPFVDDLRPAGSSESTWRTP